MPRRKKPTRGELFVAEQNTWLGTPFIDNQATKHRGTDCKGLVYGPMRDLGWPEAESAYAQSRDYNLRKSDGIPGQTFREGMADIFDEVSFEDRQIGDIFLCRLKSGGQPSHLVTYTGLNERGAERVNHAQIKSKPYAKSADMRAVLFYYDIDSAWRLRKLGRRK